MTTFTVMFEYNIICNHAQIYMYAFEPTGHLQHTQDFLIIDSITVACLEEWGMLIIPEREAFN